MSIKRTYAIFLRQIYLMRDTPMRFFQMFIWIGLDIILWGLISKYLADVSGSGLNFTSIFLGAVLLWDFTSQVMQGVTISFFEDVWTSNFLNIFASPIKTSEYILGVVLIGIGRGAITLIAMLLLASLVFGFPVFVYGSYLALHVFTLFLFGIALGIIGVSIVLRFGPSAEWLVWPIPAIISPFVGVFYPLSVLPQWMQYVGHALPPSYVFTGIRNVITGGEASVSTLLIGTALSAVYIFIAYGLFVMVYKKAVRSGLLARYGAEGP